MLLKLLDPIKALIKLLETFRKIIEKKLTAQTVNHIAIILVVAIIILSSQYFIVKVIGLQ